MAAKYIEITVRLMEDSYKPDVVAYKQCLNYEYFHENMPNMVAQIAAVVNNLPIPSANFPEKKLWNNEDVYRNLDKEFNLYKSKA